MLLQEKLEILADVSIPNKIHPFLHVNCQKAWTARIKDLIKSKQVKPSNKNLTLLAKNWEPLLFNYYGTKN